MSNRSTCPRKIDRALCATLTIFAVFTVAACRRHTEAPRSEGARSLPQTPTQVTEQDEKAAGPGNWRRVRTRDTELTAEQREEMEKLAALGYLTGVRDTAREGVTRYDPARSFAGVNLYSSGHGPEALLIDMKGQELHRWRFDFKTAFPDYPSDKPHIRGMDWWCWLHAFANGDLLAIFNGAGLIKVNAASQLLWAKPYRAHHDLAVAGDGTIYVLTHEPRLRPSVHPKKPILEDYVTILAADGTYLRSFSILDAFEGTSFADLWKTGARSGDILHTNSMRLLRGRTANRDKAFVAGNLLISIWKPSTLAVIEPKTEKVVWAAQGPWRSQHDAQITDAGTLLFFDNVGAKTGSRVLELDPGTKQVLWEYHGSQNEPLRSDLMGSVQRLPNGNTLIAESEGGRAIEVTRGGKIVWEFYNPHRSGTNGEFIACICRMQRTTSLENLRPGREAAQNPPVPH